MLRLHLRATYVYSNFNTTILHMLTLYKSIRKYKILCLFIIYAHNTLGWKPISTFRQFNRKVYYRCHRIRWLGLIDRKRRISYWISTFLKQLNGSTFIQKPISSNQRFRRSYAADSERVLRSTTLEKISSIPSEWPWVSWKNIDVNRAFVMRCSFFHPSGAKVSTRETRSSRSCVARFPVRSGKHVSCQGN